MAGAGGYNYEFVTTPPDRLVCKILLVLLLLIAFQICHNLCHDPHLTNCCGAHFC